MRGSQVFSFNPSQKTMDQTVDIKTSVACPVNPEDVIAFYSRFSGTPVYRAFFRTGDLCKVGLCYYNSLTNQAHSGAVLEFNTEDEAYSFIMLVLRG